MNKKDKELLVEMHKKGISRVECAKHFGCTISVIHVNLRNMGLTRRNNCLTLESKELIKRMYLEGSSTTECANKSGHTRNTVTKYLKREGLYCNKKRMTSADK